MNLDNGVSKEKIYNLIQRIVRIIGEFWTAQIATPYIFPWMIAAIVVGFTGNALIVALEAAKNVIIGG